MIGWGAVKRLERKRYWECMSDTNWLKKWYREHMLFLIIQNKLLLKNKKSPNNMELFLEDFLWF